MDRSHGKTCSEKIQDKLFVEEKGVPLEELGGAGQRDGGVGRGRVRDLNGKGELKELQTCSWVGV